MFLRNKPSYVKYTVAFQNLYYASQFQQVCIKRAITSKWSMDMLSNLISDFFIGYFTKQIINIFGQKSGHSYRNGALVICGFNLQMFVSVRFVKLE